MCDMKIFRRNEEKNNNNNNTTLAATEAEQSEFAKDADGEATKQPNILPTIEKK